jgi:hypothetical protein
VKGKFMNREITPDEIGWCHNCGTLQLFRDAPWLTLGWMGDGERHPCCFVCRESEPWEFGVWPVAQHGGGESLIPCALAHHETWNPGVCEQCSL